MWPQMRRQVEQKTLEVARREAPTGSRKPANTVAPATGLKAIFANLVAKYPDTNALLTIWLRGGAADALARSESSWTHARAKEPPSPKTGAPRFSVGAFQVLNSNFEQLASRALTLFGFKASDPVNDPHHALAQAAALMYDYSRQLSRKVLINADGSLTAADAEWKDAVTELNQLAQALSLDLRSEHITAVNLLLKASWLAGPSPKMIAKLADAKDSRLVKYAKKFV